MKSYQNEAEFYIQKDCIIEASSYVNYQNNWFRHAPFRLRKLAKVLTDEILEKMSFPSSAFQILLGGKMWAQGLYLNFVRHTTFLYADLIDNVDFSNKREGLQNLADLIDTRYESIKTKLDIHNSSDDFEINLNEMYSYWGKYYLYSDELCSFNVKVWDVDTKFEKGLARIRDVYHYESMRESKIGFEKMIVANTGFSQHIKKDRKIKILPIEIICAASRQLELFE